MQIEVGFFSHVGRVRETNQDCVGVFQPRSSLLGKRGLPLYVVADGMGGHQGGEVASRIVVDTLGDYLQQGKKISPQELLSEAVNFANHQVYRQSSLSPELRGMGTTVVAATIYDDSLVIANVGDSRAYMVDHDSIRLITQDHSMIEEQVRAGMLSVEQAEKASGRNILTRSLGRRDQVEVDIFDEDWPLHHTLVLCTDGLWGVLSDEQIMVIASELDPQPASEKLVEMAIRAQSKDNVSIIVARRTG